MTIDWGWLAIGMLGSWRVASAIVRDQGPFDVLDRLRRIGVGWGLGRLVTCVHCLGFYTSILASLLLFPLHPDVIMVILAMWAGASLLEALFAYLTDFVTAEGGDRN